ncbi:pro-neuregulin-3, membrane-bound isoform isoform X2 [Betta splendens]|uniref:Pro-neuregulin-3, membrane-bound isoform isoform X2 n=1 Tax=Betta splendens TaxID=158456 RepID=A0A6P7LB81_BETSP|nr:pro-neuregulin-3, membrane-bound isoform isoform X2 [Betta splendens]
MPLHHSATCLTSRRPERRLNPGRMSERSGASTLAAMTLEEPGAEQASPRAPGPLRCGPCAVWPRQQTWLCAVPLVMGFVGLGLSLMLLKWIVVGSVQDYVPTDLVDPKGSIGQDPIFLSKPSAMPKGPDISTSSTSAASTTALVSTTTPLAADGTAPAPRTRSGPPANHSANGSAANGDGNRAPHLHNRVSTRISGTVVTASTTRSTRLTPPPGGKEVTPRSTVRKDSRAGDGRNGAANSKPGQTSAPISTTASTTSTATMKITAKVQPTTSQPAAPVKPTSRWNHGRPGKGPATRPHHRLRTLAPTLPSLRSEVFKPCVEDKDLAFCLNEGECSIIETVAGVHRHCRCKEGYHGLRCDQFVPKTDAILSDPTDELGIEFMESGDTYQRQVLSIFSIASGICLLGVACMALYRRNKRHREKLQAHFSDSRSLRDCSVNASGLMSKSPPRLQYGIQLQKSGSSPHGSIAKGGSASAAAAPPVLSRALSRGKRCRSSSLSLSPAQQRRHANYFRTPPTARGKHKIPASLLDGPRAAGHVYKHLQEDESADVESIKRCDSAGGRVGALLSRGSLAHFAARKGWTEVSCTRLDKGPDVPPCSLHTRSVPIIPSLQACDPEAGRVGASDQHRGRLLKCRAALAGKAGMPVSDSASVPCETAAPGAEPGMAPPPSTSPSPCSIETTVELVQELNQNGLPGAGKARGPRGEVRESEGVPHAGGGARGAEAAGQREAQGQCRGRTALGYVGTKRSAATKEPSCRGAASAHATPTAS